MFVLVGLTLLPVVYLTVCWFILFNLITPERKRADFAPATLGFYDAQRVSFKSIQEDILLRGWLLPAAGDRVIVLVHGIHSHAWECQAPDLARAYVDAGFAVLLFDLRAHGDSGGTNTGLGLLERGDLQAAVQLLRQRGFEAGNIGIHGTSFGAAVALLARAEIPEIGAIVADSAFANIREVIGGELERQTGIPAALLEILMPGLNWLAAVLYSVDIDAAAPETAIRRIVPRPILLIHGIDDPVIPFEHARRLKNAAGTAAELWAIPGGHTQGLRMGPLCDKPAATREAFLEKVSDFFDKNLGTQGSRHR